MLNLLEKWEANGMLSSWEATKRDLRMALDGVCDKGQQEKRPTFWTPGWGPKVKRTQK